MSYIGKTPTPAPLTSSDITDGIISTDKLAANAVVTSKITDGTISNADVNATLVTGQTAETSIADGDTILIHDASASALRKMTKVNFVSGIGGANTPAFFAHKTGDQTVAQDTQVLVAFETEVFDTDNTFTNTSGNYKFTPGVSGKYVIHASLYFATPAAGNFHRIYVYKNGSSIAELSQINNGYEEGMNMSTIVESDTDDYFQIYTRHNKGSSIAVQGNSTWGAIVSSFGAYKLIT